MSVSLLAHDRTHRQHQALPDQRFTVGGRLHCADAPVEPSTPPLIEVVVQETGRQARIEQAKIQAEITYRLLGLSRLRYDYKKGKSVDKEPEQETHYTLAVSLQAVRGVHTAIETFPLNLPATDTHQLRDYDLHSSRFLVTQLATPVPPLDSWFVVRGRFVSVHPLLAVTVLERAQAAHMLLDIRYETPQLPFPYAVGGSRSPRPTTYTLILKMLGVEYSRQKLLIPEVDKPQEQCFGFDICYSEPAEGWDKVWKFVPTRKISQELTSMGCECTFSIV